MFGGVLLPYSWKGSWALCIRASSRNLAFALGHESSGKVNPRGSPKRAAQGRSVSTLLQGRDSVQVFITRLGLVPPVCPEMLPMREIKWLFPTKQTGLQKSQWRAQRRSDLVSFPESFPKVEDWLVGANSFWAGAPEPPMSSSLKRTTQHCFKKKGIYRHIHRDSFNLLPPSSLVSLGPSHQPALRLSLEPPSFPLEISQDFLILLPSSRTLAAALRKPLHFSESSSVHSTSPRGCARIHSNEPHRALGPYQHLVMECGVQW